VTWDIVVEGTAAHAFRRGNCSVVLRAMGPLVAPANPNSGGGGSPAPSKVQRFRIGAGDVADVLIRVRDHVREARVGVRGRGWVCNPSGDKAPTGEGMLDWYVYDERSVVGRLFRLDDWAVGHAEGGLIGGE
jgi:hypothetical protein